MNKQYLIFVNKIKPLKMTYLYKQTAASFYDFSANKNFVAMYHYFCVVVL